MTTTGKVLTFFGIGALVAIIYNANKKPSEDTNEKSDFLGFGRKARLQAGASHWCKLEAKRKQIADLLASGTIRSANEVTSLQMQISTIVAEMSGIVTSLFNEGYSIVNCKAVVSPTRQPRICWCAGPHGMVQCPCAGNSDKSKSMTAGSHENSKYLTGNAGRRDCVATGGTVIFPNGGGWICDRSK